MRGKCRPQSSVILPVLAVALAVVLTSPGPAAGVPIYYVDTTTSAGRSGVPISDGDSNQDASPVSAVASSNLQNPRARGYASAAAGPGSVAAVSIAKVSGVAPGGDTMTGVAYNAASSTITDLIFTGPGTSVTASLNLAWSGTMGDSVYTYQDNTRSLSNTQVNISGSIFRPSSTTFMSFGGYRDIGLDKQWGQPVDTDLSETGILSSGAYPPSGPLVTDPFVVPTGEALSLELSMATFSGVGIYDMGGSIGTWGQATSSAKFGSTLSFPTSGDVFDLPAGYSASSVEAGIVDNQWTGTPVTAPIPEPLSLILFAPVVALIASRRRQRQIARH